MEKHRRLFLIFSLAIVITNCDETKSKRGRPIPFRFGKRSLTDLESNGDDNNNSNGNKSANDEDNNDYDWNNLSIGELEKRARPFRYGKRGRVIPFRFGKRFDESIAGDLTQAWRHLKAANGDGANEIDGDDLRNIKNEVDESGVAEDEDVVDRAMSKRVPRPLRFGKRASLASEAVDAAPAFDAAYFYDEDYDADVAALDDAAFLNKVAMSDAIKRTIPFRFGKRTPIPFRFGKRSPIPLRFGKRVRRPLRFG